MQVELYIYLPNNFEVTADLTSITADSDIITADVTMLEDLYTAEKLDLFQDEKISVTQNLLNYQDISKLFADYSQSFTIPASTHNNYVLKYWYDNALVNGFDARYRYDGFIEIDKVRFKIGTFQLDSVTVKDRKPENYKITFFGKVKQLKDLFGDDKLSVLDYSSLNHSYTASEILSRITSSSSYDVRYPLLAHDRLYDFGGGGANDVTTNAGAIVWTSLFPSIKVSKIFDLIESKYSINFNSIFFNAYMQYSDLWLLLKNAESMTSQSVPLKIDFTSKSSGWNGMDLTADDCDFYQVQEWTYISTPNETYYGSIIYAGLTITTASTVNYKINYYQNGLLIGASSTLSGTQTIDVTSLRNMNVNNRVYFEIQTDSPMTFTSSLDVTFSKSFFNGTSFITRQQTKTATGTSQTTISDINIQNYIPDIKLYDFFMGIVKMFNLVIVPTSETDFTIEPLELWYSIGKTNNITQNVIEDTIDITPPKIYKEISFNYEKSENILNNAFRELFTPIRGFDYGDLRYISDTNVTDSKYEIRLPFENVMFEKDNSSTFQTATFKDKNLNNYVPKPVLIYNNGLSALENSSGTSVPIKYYNGSTYQNISSYIRFSNELAAVPTDSTNLLSTCWNNEQSSWFINSLMNGLYQNQYSQWITNLYDVKARILNCKAYFNSYELSNISMNDRIVIKDQRYVINNLTTDLTTGETDIELLTDFRSNLNFVGSTIGFRMANIENINTDKNPLDINIVAFLDQFDQFDYVASPNGLLTYVLKTGVTDNDEFNLTMPVNTTGIQRTDQVVLRYYLDGEEYYYFINVTQEG